MCECEHSERPEIQNNTLNVAQLPADDEPETINLHFRVFLSKNAVDFI